MTQASQRSRSLLLVFLLSFLLSFPFLSRAFYTRGEPREALVAQSMLLSGNWISPLAYNGAVPSKPPFSHWLIALSSLPVGDVTEATCRLPTAVAFVLFSVSFFLFLAKRSELSVALLSSLLLLASPEWLRSGSTCRVDTLLATSFAGALLALYGWHARGMRGYPFMAAALLSCAALTKGPVGLVLPLAIFSLYRLLQEGVSALSILRISASAAMVAVPVLVVASSWYVAGYFVRGDEFIHKIWYENVARFTSSMEDEPHKHAALYLLGMLFLMLLPWSLAWLWAVAGRLRAASAMLRWPVAMWKQASDLQRFSLVAALSITAFFCIPSSKRSVYLLPAYPFFAFLAASTASVWAARSDRLLRVLLWVARGLVALLLVAALVAIAVPVAPESERFAGSMLAATGLAKLAVIVAGLACVRRIIRGGVAAGLTERLAVTMVVVAVVAGPAVIDPMMLQISPRRWLASPEFAEAAHPERQERMYSFGSESYAASFYLKKPFLGAGADLPQGSLVFVEEKNLGRFRDELKRDYKEVSRYSSGLEGKKALVVIEVGSELQQ